MTTSSEQRRAWAGPTLFTYGFRPFFLGAGLWAALAMVLWMGVLSRGWHLPTAFDSVSWHAHEFMFGYLGSVIAGFLLTAVPNWTGGLPIVGWRLVGLFGLWLAGRVVVLVSGYAAPVPVALVDLAMPLVLGAALLREIVAGKNWRNLPVVGLLGLFAFANAVFHCEAARGQFAAQGLGLRLGLAAAVMMVALIGGRIVPSFTRNWLANNHPGRLPVPPEQTFDKAALALLLAAVLSWSVWPAAALSAGLLGLAGAAHALRLARWAGDRTLAEPLVWVLHVAYAFVPLGALGLAVAHWAPQVLPVAAAQHLWMAGTIGLMSVAVMSRATRGHTGHALSAGARTVAIYGGLAAAALVRLAGGMYPAAASVLYVVSGALWVAAFAGFVALYGPMLVAPRKKR